MWTRSLLPRLFTSRQWHLHWDFHVICRCWGEIAGPEIAAHARPNIIRHRTLWIAVDDSAWLHHLQLLKPQLLKRINDLLQDRQLEDMRFVMQPDLPDLQEEAVPTQPPAQPITAETQRRIRELTASLADDDARHALQRLWLRFRQNS